MVSTRSRPKPEAGSRRRPRRGFTVTQPVKIKKILVANTMLTSSPPHPGDTGRHRQTQQPHCSVSRLSCIVHITAKGGRRNSNSSTHRPRSPAHSNWEIATGGWKCTSPKTTFVLPPLFIALISLGWISANASITDHMSKASKTYRNTSCLIR